MRKGSGKLSISGGTATVNNGTAGTPVSLTNQFAIFKLTLRDIDDANDVSATSVVISDQSGTVTAVTPGSATNEIYVALPTTATTLKFLVTGSDSKKYFNMASGLTLGTNFYQSTVKLATIGNVIASNGKCYKDNASTPGGNTAVAMIAYLGDETGESAYNYTNGLALALSDANGGNTRKWRTSNTDASHTKYNSSSSFTSEGGLQYNATHDTDEYPAFKAAIANNSTAAPTGCSDWFLASGYQWTKMCAGNASALKTLASLGNAYWSSSEYSAEKAWRFSFSFSAWNYDNKGITNSVRSCLAF